MKLTPAAIRQRSFETAFRGYEKKEVAVFLDEVSEIVDRLHQENLELKSKLQSTEAEAKKLKDVEDSLFRTLKTAEDTGASIIEEANEAADLIISEANHTAKHANEHANKIISEARKQAETQAAMVIGDAERKAKETISGLRESIEALVISYENLSKQREELALNLKKLSQEALHQVEETNANFQKIDANVHLKAIEELDRSNLFMSSSISGLVEQEEFIAKKITELHQDNTFDIESLGKESHTENENLELNLDFENHESDPQIEVEEISTEKAELESPEIKIEAESPDQKEEIFENEIQQIQEETPQIEVPEEPVKLEEKTILEKPSPPEEKKNQTGSFFDQFN
jgi:cell division initiation protein